MKETNQWVMPAITLIIGLLIGVFVVNSGILGEAFVKKGTATSFAAPPAAPIAANSCDADNICEAKNVTIKQGNLEIYDSAMLVGIDQQYINFKTPTSTLEISADALNFKDGKRNSTVSSKSHTVRDDMTYQGVEILPSSIKIESVGVATTITADAIQTDKIKTGNVTTTSFYSTGDMTGKGLAGSGKAYVCVDAAGKFFRSSTSCV